MHHTELSPFFYTEQFFTPNVVLLRFHGMAVVLCGILRQCLFNSFCLQISNGNAESESAVTILSVVLVPADLAAILQYRLTPTAAWQNVSANLNGSVEPGVGMPIFAGQQIRVLPLPSVQKVSGCLEYTVAAFDNTTLSTAGLPLDSKWKSRHHSMHTFGSCVSCAWYYP